MHKPFDVWGDDLGCARARLMSGVLMWKRNSFRMVDLLEEFDVIGGKKSGLSNRHFVKYGTDRPEISLELLITWDLWCRVQPAGKVRLSCRATGGEKGLKEIRKQSLPS